MKVRKKFINKSTGNLKFPKTEPTEQVMKKLRGETEAQIQDYCEQYLNKKGIPFLHIPDAVYESCSRFSPLSEIKKVQISAYLKGVPDLMIFKHVKYDQYSPNDNNCLIVELKSEKGRLSQGQQNWNTGLKVHVIKSFEAFKDLVDEWSK